MRLDLNGRLFSRGPSTSFTLSVARKQARARTYAPPLYAAEARSPALLCARARLSPIVCVRACLCVCVLCTRTSKSHQVVGRGEYAKSLPRLVSLVGPF